MIIIGHPWIKSDVESHKYAKHCQNNDIPFAVVVSTLDDALFANALGAKYILCEEDQALMIQPIAQEYLFDTRILVLVHTDKEIAKIAREGIDGIIFPEAIY